MSVHAQWSNVVILQCMFQGLTVDPRDMPSNFHCYDVIFQCMPKYFYFHNSKLINLACHLQATFALRSGFKTAIRSSLNH